VVSAQGDGQKIPLEAKKNTKTPGAQLEGETLTTQKHLVNIAMLTVSWLTVAMVMMCNIIAGYFDLIHPPLRVGWTSAPAGTKRAERDSIKSCAVLWYE